MALVIALLTFLATLGGGLFALRYRDQLHLILGFSAGAILGVAFFDLLPEALQLTHSSFQASSTLTVLALGFIVFMLIDRFLLLHAHSDNHCENERHTQFGAGALSFHSFLDGVAIGLAFKVSAGVGVIVAIGVLTHDFSDGINTVGVVIRNQGSRSQALRWLTADAVAPVLGVLSTFLFTLSQSTLGLILALFCGFFLYLGASDILPESHHRHPTIGTTLLTVLGLVVLYIAVHLAT